MAQRVGNWSTGGQVEAATGEQVGSFKALSALRQWHWEVIREQRHNIIKAEIGDWM